MASWWFDDAVGWLATAVLAVIKFLWGLLAQTAFSTPDVTTLPQVTAITGTSAMIVNVGFVVAVLTTGIVVMARETVQNRYGIAELAPRLVIGWVSSAFAVPICQHLIEVANAVTVALTGDGVTAKDSLDRMKAVTVDALTNPPSALLAVIIGVVIAALTVMLIVTWLVRAGVLIVLVGVAPVALACHALPYTEPAARLWWRALMGTLGTVVLQAVALHTALAVFLDPHANLKPLGFPQDPTGTLNLFVVLCVLWAVVKIPGLMRRYVTSAGGGGRNPAGLVVRMLVMQRLTGLLRLPFGRSGGRAAAGAAAPRGVGRRGSGGGGGPGGGGFRIPRPSGGGGGGGAGQRRLPPPRGAGQGRVGVAWPTGRPVWPYTAQEIATGVDPYTRTVSKQPTRSSRLPVRSAGVQPPPSPAALRPVLPAGATPATAMPKTRPAHLPAGFRDRPHRS